MAPGVNVAIIGDQREQQHDEIRATAMAAMAVSDGDREEDGVHASTSSHRESFGPPIPGAWTRVDPGPSNVKLPEGWSWSISVRVADEEGGGLLLIRKMGP